MIEPLSNPSWINPQIDFLLFLQNIRMGLPDYFDKFFLSITVFGEFWLPTLICAITYWCIDFRAGIYLFSMEGFNSIITHFLKMLACVYRPWILSDKIHPSELAVPYAKGYSFPSGHSAMSSSVLGGAAFLLRRKAFVCIALTGIVLLIGFSRLWLGVHTPQDVVVGLLIGGSLIFIVNKIITWAEEKPNRYLYLTLFTAILTAFIVIYILYFNTYRMDYVNGELLVNPAKSVPATAAIYGYLLGMLSGCFLCRRFFPFNPKDISVKNRIIIGILGGSFIFFGLKDIINFIFVSDNLRLRFSFPLMLISGLFVTLIYPVIFQFVIKKTKNNK